MRATRHARTPRETGPVSPAILAVGMVVVVIAAAAVLYFVGAGRLPAPEVDAGEPPAEDVNPFEGLPPEERGG